MDNDSMVQQLSEYIQKRLSQHGIKYHEFSCINFADVNCDIRLTLDKRDIVGTFSYTGLAFLRRKVKETGIAQTGQWLFRSLIRQAYESYEFDVHENERTMKNPNAWEHMRQSAKEKQKYQKPIYQQLSQVWKQIQDESE